MLLLQRCLFVPDRLMFLLHDLLTLFGYLLPWFQGCLVLTDCLVIVFSTLTLELGLHSLAFIELITEAVLLFFQAASCEIIHFKQVVECFCRGRVIPVRLEVGLLVRAEPVSVLFLFHLDAEEVLVLRLHLASELLSIHRVMVHLGHVHSWVALNAGVFSFHGSDLILKPL